MAVSGFDVPCYHPTPARQDRPGGPVRLLPPLGTANMQVPCGVCIGCRQRRAREWATRAVHEASRHEHNSFVTLTYSPENLPDGEDLVPDDLRLFLRRVRRALRGGATRPAALCGTSMRFLACGEYGDLGARPHYHALLFGVGFTDGTRWKKDLFLSQTLDELWGKGFCSFGEVTGGRAAYVAQYSLKKVRRAEWRECTPDGVVKTQPFLRVSLRPGIGAEWLAQYKAETRGGYIVKDGVKLAVPRYYQKLLEVSDLGLSEESRFNAAERAKAIRPSEMELRAAEAIEKRRLELSDPRKFNSFTHH